MSVSSADWLEKLSGLTSRIRQGRSRELEKELVDLRLRQGREIYEDRRGNALVVPAVDDVFAGLEGLPEITGDQLSRETLASALLYHGGLLVRGLYSPKQVNRLLGLSAAEEEANRKGYGSMSCTPHTLIKLLEIYEESGLLPAVRDYLDGDPLLLADRVKLRHFRKETDAMAGIPWHQDVNFFGTNSYAVNCWAAVTSCGEGNPGLALVPHRADQRYAWKEEDGLAPLDYSTKDAQKSFDPLLEAHAPSYPVLQPGDALLFDEMTVHRTASKPWTMAEQIVTVSWFFRANAFPDWGTPLAV